MIKELMVYYFNYLKPKHFIYETTVIIDCYQY